MKYLCLGHAAYDITFQTDQYPEENSKTRVTTTVACGGGPASNAAYLLAKWGCDVAFAGLVGNDFYGKKIEKEFQTVGVDTTYLEFSDLSNTMLAFIIANKQNGTRTILTAKDKNSLFLTHIPASSYDFILLDGEEEKAAREVLKNNPTAISILDAGSYRPSTVSLCPLVNYVVCSHDFAENYTHQKMDYEDINTIIPIYNTLKKDFQTQILITLEEKGTFMECNGVYKIIPSIPVKAVDSTGAGDLFHGSFLYFLSKDFPLEKVVRLANITGALSVTKLGGRYSIPSLEEVLLKERESHVS